MKFKSAIGLIILPLLLLPSACAPAKLTAQPNPPTAVPGSNWNHSNCKWGGYPIPARQNHRRILLFQ